MQKALVQPNGVAAPRRCVRRGRRDRARSVRRRVVVARAAPRAAPSLVPFRSSSPNERVFNFSAGPACLPVAVLEQAQRELLNYRGAGMSVLEMSHRGAAFDGIAKEAEADLRTLLEIPENYEVLFVQGGASTQFSAVPLNLTEAGDAVNHIVTGSWSKKAADEARRYVKVHVVAEGDGKSIPSYEVCDHAKYVHFCDNETIHGVEFPSPPAAGDKTLVADMSSNFCSKPVDVKQYGVIYAGAQKNIGPAGVTVVIVRQDLVGKARDITPVMLNWETMTKTQSMYNTPPCYAIYICGLVFKHLMKKGGLKAMQSINEDKAKMLYDCIDGSDGFYQAAVDPVVRSKMNVPFTIPSKPELEKVFIEEAKKVGLVELKGHRSVGGMRASIYNSMPVEGVKALVHFMRDFSVKFS